MDGFEDGLKRFNAERRAAALHNLSLVIENAGTLGIDDIQVSFDALGDYEMTLGDRICTNASGRVAAWPEGMEISGLQKAVGDPGLEADARRVTEEELRPLADVLERLNRELLDTEVGDWEETAYSSGTLRIDAGGAHVDAELVFLKECDPAAPVKPEAAPLPPAGPEDPATAGRRVLAHNLAVLLAGLEEAGLSEFRAGFHGRNGERRMDRTEFLRDGSVVPKPALQAVEGLQAVDASGRRVPSASASAAEAFAGLARDLLDAEAQSADAGDGLCGEVSVTSDGADLCILRRSVQRVRFDLAPAPDTVPHMSLDEPET